MLPFLPGLAAGAEMLLFLPRATALAFGLRGAGVVLMFPRWCDAAFLPRAAAPSLHLCVAGVLPILCRVAASTPGLRHGAEVPTLPRAAAPEEGLDIV